MSTDKSNPDTFLLRRVAYRIDDDDSISVKCVEQYRKRIVFIFQSSNDFECFFIRFEMKERNSFWDSISRRQLRSVLDVYPNQNLSIIGLGASNNPGLQH